MADAESLPGIQTSKQYVEERRRHREECTECRFVSDLQSVATFYTRDQRVNASGKLTCVGTFTMPDWSGHEKFYLTQCQSSECERLYVDYPHGYINGGRFFLRCPECGTARVIHEADIYQEKGLKAPPTLWQEFVLWLKLWWKYRS